MRVLTSAEEFQLPDPGEHSAFLVGPTPRRADVKSWRPEALALLREIKYNGLVYAPEPFCTRFPDFGDNYVAQIDWETHGLNYTSVIIAWVPRALPDMMALTTNVEFGEFHKDPRFIYGRPDNAEHCGYLDYKYRNRTKGPGIQLVHSPFGNEPFNNLRELLEAATIGFCG